MVDARANPSVSRQSRIMSLVEAITNVVVGYALAIVMQILVFPWFGLEAALREHFTIGLAFVGVSLARGYLLRRISSGLARELSRRIVRSMSRQGDHDAPPASDVQEERRSVLPQNLAGSLQHLSEQDITRLSEAVASEMERRGFSGAKLKRPVSVKSKPDPVLSELSRPQMSLIRSSIRAGVKPAALSRQFGLTRAQITAALEAEE